MFQRTKFFAFAFAFASLCLAACGHQWNESIDSVHAPRHKPAYHELDLQGRPAAEQRQQLESEGYVLIGTLTYRCKDCIRVESSVARRAARAGADLYLVTNIETVRERHTRGGGYVIVGSGTAANPEYKNVTAPQTITVSDYTVQYWRRESAE